MTLTVTDDDGATATAARTLELSGEVVPPDPAAVAPPVEPAVLVERLEPFSHRPTR